LRKGRQRLLAALRIAPETPPKVRQGRAPVNPTRRDALATGADKKGSRPTALLNDLQAPARAPDFFMQVGPCFGVQERSADPVGNLMLSWIACGPMPGHPPPCRRCGRVPPQDRRPAPFRLQFAKGRFDPCVALTIRRRLSARTDPIRHDVDVLVLGVVVRNDHGLMIAHSEGLENPSRVVPHLVGCDWFVRTIAERQVQDRSRSPPRRGGSDGHFVGGGVRAVRGQIIEAKDASSAIPGQVPGEAQEIIALPDLPDHRPSPWRGDRRGFGRSREAKTIRPSAVKSAAVIDVVNIAMARTVRVWRVMLSLLREFRRWREGDPVLLSPPGPQQPRGFVSGSRHARSD
jgi:hypothetical protein